MRYVSADGRFSSATVPARVTVAKATPRLAVKRSLRPGTVRLRVRVTAAGVRPTGKVTLRGAGKPKSARLRDGVVTFTVPRSGRTVRVGYAGDATVARRTVRVSLKR